MFEMSNELAIEVLETEKKCVKRNITGCCRDCAVCDLVLPDDVILSAYDWAIRLLSEGSFSNDKNNEQDNVEDKILNIGNRLGRQLAEVLARRLNGRQYGDEMTNEECDWAKKNGLVVVFGASDDLMELRGTFDDEIDCYGGGDIVLDTMGINVDKKTGRFLGNNIIKAVWCNKDIIPQYSWTYETDIPHSTFNVMEDDEYYCRGIVFSIHDLK